MCALARLCPPQIGRMERSGFRQVLHEFISKNRELIIARARERVRQRTPPKALEAKLEHGVPLFLTQLASALDPVAPPEHLRLVTDDARKSITDSATLHGHDLLRNGFTVAQVVHGYGDVCQIVTELATETSAAISAGEFQTFNRCLDDAIAGAVTAYGRQRERDLAYAGTERLGVFTHEVRSLVNTAILSFDVIKKGMVGLSGSTSAIHARSLSGLASLVERSVAEVRLATGTPLLEPLFVAEFLEEVQVSAVMQAAGRGLHLLVGPVDLDVMIQVDRQLLASAVSNLLENAFKFSRADGHVSLITRVTKDRVLLEVADECGGFPTGKAETLFRPFTRGATDGSGLGLGLSIALSATQANLGELKFRDVPGKGCVFTIDLPRQAPLPASRFQVLPDGSHGPFDGSGERPFGGAHSREAKARASSREGTLPLRRT